MPQLQVMVGSDRFHMEPCRLNDTHHPHEIDNDHFTGRVLVRILDAPGAREGEPGREYFHHRSRKFCIQIEGRFKSPHHTGDDIVFGSDFDRLVDFPKTPFNAGLRVARWIDPSVYVDFYPKSGRPFIMSPFVACMNTLCAWPAPERAHDAVVVLRHTHRSTEANPTKPSSSSLVEPEKGHGDPHSALVVEDDNDNNDEGEEDDIVPAEQLHHPKPSTDTPSSGGAGGKKKKGWLSNLTGSGTSTFKDERVLKRYWRFVGFRQEPRVRALLEAHQASLDEDDHHERQQRDGEEQRMTKGQSEDRPSRQLSDRSSARNSTEVQHAPTAATLSRLGTGSRRELGRSPHRRPDTPEHDGNGSLPVSPVIGSNELATAAPGDVDELPSGEGEAAAANSISSTDASSSGGVAGLGGPVANGGVTEASSNSAPTTTKATTTTTAAPSNTSMSPAASSEAKPEMPKLERITTEVRQEMAESAKSDGLHDGDFKLADTLHYSHISSTTSSSPSSSAPKSTGGTTTTTTSAAVSSNLDAQLGPWRFSNPSTDMVEDNAFIFTTHSLPVPQRRQHFADKSTRQAFRFDPDIVYGASFFTDAMDFNTFNLGLGPVKLNLKRFFEEMPVRYTLRSAREEEVTMCTVSFQIV